MNSPRLRQEIFASLTTLLVLPALCLPSMAQRRQNSESYYRAPSSMQGKTVIIPSGTTFEGRIDSTIGSSASQNGQRFTITMSTPVLANGVDVLIPAGSQILGEVVEAIASNEQPSEKGLPKPVGKLRVQLSGLRTPDGITYPMVASLVGESIDRGRRGSSNPNLGGGVAYMGSAASFEAVAPGAGDRYRGRSARSPRVVTKDELLRDPIYGSDRNRQFERQGGQSIRSLVRRKNDLFIDSGSPLSIKLDAPFKIAFNPINPGSPVVDPEPVQSQGRHFGKPSSEQLTGTENQIPAVEAKPQPVAPPVDNSF